MGAVIACGPQKVLSGRDGRFSINAVNSNTVSLVISMVGYKKDTVALSDSNTRLVINMQRSSKMLDDVVITGTITNMCRYEGKPACSDSGTDLNPTAIWAGSPPAR